MFGTLTVLSLKTPFAEPEEQAQLASIDRFVIVERTRPHLQTILDNMIAEVISIGDELTSGHRLDTNSQWISQQLGDLGSDVLFHTTVGDDLEANVNVFQIAAGRADVVVATGGLGPTEDDLTRQAIANAFGETLVTDQEALKHIESLFAAREREMPERNRLQALRPENGSMISNPHGTAPGIDFRTPSDPSCHIFALPGVPAEMKTMFLDHVVDRLKSMYSLGKQQRFHRTLKLFGIGESDIEVHLPGLINRDREPRVGITASHATISLRLSTFASSENESLRVFQSTEEEIREKLSNYIFGINEQELQHVIASELIDLQQSISVVELGGPSPAGSWLQESMYAAGSELFQTRLSFPDCSTASKFFGAGENHLQATVDSIAVRARECLSSDWLLIAGEYPSHSSVANQIGLPPFPFEIGIYSSQSRTAFETVRLGGHPDILNSRFGKSALYLLWKAIRNS